MKNIIHFILSKLDSFIVKAAGWKHIPHSDTNFMYVNLYKYKGLAITLTDGTIIEKGDCIPEFHLDNKRLKGLDTSYTSLIRLLKGELKALGNCIRYEPYSKIKAVYGITVFYEIAARQGFTVLDMKNIMKRYLWSLWENILRLSFQKRNKRARKRIIMSKECWISRGQILLHAPEGRG